MKSALKIVCLWVLAAIAASASALDSSGLVRGMTYQEAQTWHEKFLRGEPTKAERLEAMRELVRSSRLGDRGLQRVFRNFEGRYAIDPRIPGVEKSVLMQLSSSTSQAKGYRRELLYASAFDNDVRYTLEAMNRQLRRSWGNTDADIVIRHGPSGLYGRVEVKDYSLNSQSTNLKDLKIQIDKMAREGQRTGQLQFWINRREVLPEIERYAKRRGVIALGNVSTGRNPLGRTVSSDEALNLLHRQFLDAARVRAISGGGQLGFGAFMAIKSAPDAYDDIRMILDSTSNTPDMWLRLGEHGSYVLAGGGMASSGAAMLASTFAEGNLQGRLYSVGRVGGIASAAFFVVGEGFLVARYWRGDVNSREFRTEQWVLATTGGAALGGGWIGTVILKNPAWGSAIGGTVGSIVGQAFGRRTANYYYEREFAELDVAFGEAVYQRYGLN